MIYIRQGIQYSVPFCATTNPIELQVITHMAERRQISITNVYLTPHRLDYSSNHQNDQSWRDHLPKEPDLVCGNFNAYHSSWDYYVSTDTRGLALHDLMEAHTTAPLNDGSPTRAVRCEHSDGISTLDVTLVDTAMADRFSWETIAELGSDHLPLLLIWSEDIKVERDHTRRRPKRIGSTPKRIGFLPQMPRQWYPGGVIGRLRVQTHGGLLQPPKKGRDRGHPHQGGPQKRDPLDECPTETAYS